MRALSALTLSALLLSLGCGDDSTIPADDGGVLDSGPVPMSDAGFRDAGPFDAGFVDDMPPAGNPEAPCPVPDDGAPRDTSAPDHVVGDGDPANCTDEAFFEAVEQGGVITFDCGPEPVTIELSKPAAILNDSTPEIVIDGGGLVTLSGRGENRILYMNTCDEDLVWTTPNCDNQDHPVLTVQNLTFVDGFDDTPDEPGAISGGGAIYASGGRLRIVNSRFFRNRSVDVGPDTGGAAVRAFQQYEGMPLHVVGSTFGGGADWGNSSSNGGALSSIGVSWTIINSVLSHNVATGEGGNPARSGTPGGGSGGAIYNDGRTMTLSICGTRIENNQVNTHGSAIFFVSNDHTGTIRIDRSIITGNTGGGWYDIAPQISGFADTDYTATDSTIE